MGKELISFATGIFALDKSYLQISSAVMLFLKQGQSCQLGKLLVDTNFPFSFLVKNLSF